MAGPERSADAARLIDDAWRNAAFAEMTDGAPARVANDRAMAAARAGDRATTTAMLSVDRFNRVANSGQGALASNLPLCGADGIRVDDRVVVDVARWPADGRPRATLLWASRPGIARPFLTAVSQGSLTVNDGHFAMFELACRSIPTVEYAARGTTEEKSIGWATGLGAYALYDEDNQFSTSQLASMLAQREARYGQNSVMLLPILARALEGANLTGASDTATMRHLAETAARIEAILAANRAPAEILLMARIGKIGTAVGAQTKAQADGVSELQALLVATANDPTIAPDTIYTIAVSAAAAPGMTTTFQQTVLEAGLEQLKRRLPADDRFVVAATLRLYALRKSLGDAAGADALIRPLNLPGDLCTLSDPPVRMVSQNIRSEDYPADLIFMQLQGLTAVEFDLDAAGSARPGHMLIADPPRVFDAIAMDRVPTIRYEPARFGGMTRPCRGVVQSIRWQIPY